MKNFITKTLFFLSIPFLLLFILLGTLNSIDFNVNALSKNTAQKTIFLGDSHIEKAINDTMLTNSFNLAQNSESFYFSYYKLKKIAETYPSVKKVYLGYSYHSISSYYDKFIDGENSSAISTRYFFLLPIGEKIKMIIAYKKDLLSYFIVLIKNGFTDILSKTKPYEGFFANEYSNTLAIKSSMDRRLAFQFFTNDSLNDFSLKNIAYLSKIKNLCNEHNIALTLINVPVYKYYKSKVPEKFIEKFNELPIQLNIKLIDFGDLLKDEKCFIPDGDHVSLKGAFITTKYFKKAILIK